MTLAYRITEESYMGSAGVRNGRHVWPIRFRFAIRRADGSLLFRFSVERDAVETFGKLAEGIGREAVAA